MKVHHVEEKPREAFAFEGFILKKVQIAETEIIISCQDPGNPDRQAHLIARPEAHLVTDPTTGQPALDEQGHPVVQVTGVKYEIGEGPLAIMTQTTLELSGRAAEIIDKPIMYTAHSAHNSTFAFSLGDQAQYSLLLTPVGPKVTYTRELTCEWRKPVKLQ